MTATTTARRLGARGVSDNSFLLAREQLERAGKRWTGARLVILTLLVDAPAHKTLAQLGKEAAALAPRLNMSTIQRTLHTLSECGLVHAVHLHHGATYGLTDGPHQHAVCTRCCVVQELPGAAWTTTVEAIEDASGLALGVGGLVAYGLCSRCQRRPAPGRSALPAGRWHG